MNNTEERVSFCQRIQIKKCCAKCKKSYSIMSCVNCAITFERRLLFPAIHFYLSLLYRMFLATYVPNNFVQILEFFVKNE